MKSAKWVNHSLRLRAGLLLLGFGMALPALAQPPIVYPAKGQSNAQMAVDKGECEGWATQQTGVNPSNTEPSASQPKKGGALRGGAKGAAAGAAIGAIAGDAGKGAAIGAAAGGIGGAAKRHRQQQEQAVQAQAQSQQMSAYYKAYTACLKGRGYSVE